jgi:hypothetical protein
MEKTYIIDPNRPNHHFDRWIMYEPGTGGNFLAYQMLKNYYQTDRINLRINAYNNEYHVLSPLLHKAFYTEGIDSNSRLMISHFPILDDIPHLTSTWEKIDIIKTDWFSELLLWLKRNYTFKITDSNLQQIIPELLTIMLQSFDNATVPDIVQQICSGHPINLKNYGYGYVRESLLEIEHIVYKENVYSNNVYFWMMYSMINDKPLSLENFRDFTAKHLLEKIRNIHKDKSDAIANALGSITSADIRVLKYKDVFVNKTDTIPGVMSNAIDEYNRKNVEFVRSIYPCIDDKTAALLEKEIIEYFSI